MRLVTIKQYGKEIGALRLKEGILPLHTVNEHYQTQWKETILELIQSQELNTFIKWIQSKEDLKDLKLLDEKDVIFAPIYRKPPHIFGIGLNYPKHCKDIGSDAPDGFPGSFFKEPEILIGPKESIQLPNLKEAQRTTAEAELGIIIGKTCRDISEKNWLEVVAGYVAILDMTEESILKGNDYLKGNPRYLTLVKNFPTFFSLGMELITSDEIQDIEQIEVQSVYNQNIYASNTVKNMIHKPSKLVALHSKIQGWYAGDILMTGTPRAFEIHEGNLAECRIKGFNDFDPLPLVNPVIKGGKKNVSWIKR